MRWLLTATVGLGLLYAFAHVLANLLEPDQRALMGFLAGLLAGWWATAVFYHQRINR